MPTKIDKRNQAIGAAYKQAKIGALGAAKTWIRRAVTFAPLDPLQIKRLEQWFSSIDLRFLGVVYQDEQIENAMNALEKRFGFVRP